MRIDRRNLIRRAAQLAGCACTLSLSRLAGASSGASEPRRGSGPIDAATSLKRLKEGNRHFCQHKFHYPHQSVAWREKIANEQKPFAVVLGCSDSRVPPEIIFDEGLGDLFVIREAGHVADDATIASIEYAVGHLGVPLVMVLGHEQCGAVKATVDAVISHTPPPGHMSRLVDDIRPAVVSARNRPGDLLDLAVRVNTAFVVSQLQKSGPLLNRYVEQGRVKVVGAYYGLHTGRVDLIEA